MSGISRKLMSAAGAAGGAEALAIEDVFSTYLYQGNGRAKSVSNGINLGGTGSGGFGGAAGFLQTSGEYLEIIDAASGFTFGNNDFTIEFFLYRGYANTLEILLEWRNTGGNQGARPTLYTSSGQLFYYLGTNVITGPTLNLNQWYHIAVSRSGTSTRMFVDGTQVGSTYTDTNTYLGPQGSGIYLNELPSLGYQTNGFYSNLRIVNGTALYTADFTPPTSALTSVTNTVLLLLQGNDPFTDNSPSTITVNQAGSPDAVEFGPFDADIPDSDGGLIWVKNRDDAATNNLLTDTDRGASWGLYSNATDAQAQGFGPDGGISGFNTNGFTLSSSQAEFNTSGKNYTSWSFKKAPRFFDVVTYTGGSGPQAIAHNLGTTPGTIIIKEYGGVNSWVVYHRSFPSGYGLLESTNAFSTASAEFVFGDNVTVKAPTDTEFYIGTAQGVNNNNDLYVAYLFAHDPLGPSGDGSDGMIACGSYTGNGSTNGPEIDLGWEPQWVMLRNTSGSNWLIVDNMRGVPVGSNSARLFADSSTAELITYQDINFTSTGFKLVNTGGYNTSGQDVIYIAIRRGPMRVPTSATEVFAPVAYSGDGVSGRVISGFGFPNDLAITKSRSNANNNFVIDRLRGADADSMGLLITNTTDAEAYDATNRFINIDYMDGFEVGSDTDANSSGRTYVSYGFRRAPNFFDVVAYTGDGLTSQDVPHNLGAVPEMMIVKDRNGTLSWRVYHGDLGNDVVLELNNAGSVSGSNAAYWNNTTPTDSVFTAGSVTNVSARNYIAYLFASLDGVSKVGSYTGTGVNWNIIDCGFTSGARFVLIKKASGLGQWYLFDTARGITTTDQDPALYLNSTTAERVENPDLGIYNIIQPDTSGFQVRYSDLNNSGDTYIFLAIA